MCWIVITPKGMLNSYPPVPVNGTLFGNRVVVAKVRSLGWAIIQITDVLKIRGKVGYRGTQGRWPYGDGGRSWITLPQTKECLGLPEAEKGKEGSPSRGFRGCMALSTS